jgi:hypothetical protein
MFSKDVIKEAYADVFGAQPPDDRPQREWNRQVGAAASVAMWALLADSACGAVVESTWPSNETWQYVEAGLAAANIGQPLQIWCEVPSALARKRYESRRPTRHAIHGEPPNDEEWGGRWTRATPLPISDTLRIDTSRTVDVGAIANWCVRSTTSAQSLALGKVRRRPNGRVPPPY